MKRLVVMLALVAGCHGARLDSFLYAPVKTDDYKLPSGVVELTIPSTDGVTLHAAFVQGTEPFTLVYCHGQGGDITDSWPRIELLEPLGYNLLIWDYRGFGRSTGTPSERGIQRRRRGAVERASSAVGSSSITAAPSAAGRASTSRRVIRRRRSSRSRPSRRSTRSLPTAPTPICRAASSPTTRGTASRRSRRSARSRSSRSTAPPTTTCSRNMRSSSPPRIRARPSSCSSPAPITQRARQDGLRSVSRHRRRVRARRAVAATSCGRARSCATWRRRSGAAAASSPSPPGSRARRPSRAPSTVSASTLPSPVSVISTVRDRRRRRPCRAIEDVASCAPPRASALWAATWRSCCFTYGSSAPAGVSTASAAVSATPSFGGGRLSARTSGSRARAAAAPTPATTAAASRSSPASRRRRARRSAGAADPSTAASAPSASSTSHSRRLTSAVPPGPLTMRRTCCIAHPCDGCSTQVRAPLGAGEQRAQLVAHAQRRRGGQVRNSSPAVTYACGLRRRVVRSS